MAPPTVLLCVPDGEIAAAAAAVAARAAGRALLGRHRPRAPRAARGVLAASADDRAGRRAPGRARRRGLRRRRRPRRGRSRSPRRSPPRSACAPCASRTRTAPPTTPPPRSPRTSSSRSRARPSGSRRPPGVDRALLAPLVRAAVEDWAALGAERALTGPIARGDEETVARQRAAVAERTPDLLPLFDALVDATRAVAHVRTIRTIAEMRAHVAPRPRPRAHGRPRADDGRLPRRPPLADARGPRALRRGRRLAVRQPGAVQRLRRPRRLPAQRGARRRRGGRAGRRRAVRAGGARRSTRPGSPRPCASRACRTCSRAPSAARSTSPASAPS